jgi:hypothetical protein
VDDATCEAHGRHRTRCESAALRRAAGLSLAACPCTASIFPLRQPLRSSITWSDVHWKNASVEEALRQCIIVTSVPRAASLPAARPCRWGSKVRPEECLPEQLGACSAGYPRHDETKLATNMYTIDTLAGASRDRRRVADHLRVRPRRVCCYCRTRRTAATFRVPRETNLTSAWRTHSKT